MLRCAELHKGPEKLGLCFNDSDSSMETLLRGLGVQIADQQTGHIYVELPSALMYEDWILEEWLEERKDWKSYFQGILLEDTQVLGPQYKEFYEEFARSTQSSMIVARSKMRKTQELPWLGEGGFSFGRHVGLFEDDLFGEAQWERDANAYPQLSALEEEMEELYFPVLASTSDYLLEKVFEECSSGDFGELWGMEFMAYDTSPSGDEEWRLSTLTPRELFVSRTQTQGTEVRGLSRKVGVLRFAGVGLQAPSLRDYLVANELIEGA